MKDTQNTESKHNKEYSEEDLVDRVRRYIDTQEKRVELMEQELSIVDEDLGKYRED